MHTWLPVQSGHQTIIISRMATILYPAVEEAKLAWNGNPNLPSHAPPADTKQKA